MALKGMAKTDYQREYMRKRRGGRLLDPVRPDVRPMLDPHQEQATPVQQYDVDGNPMPDH